MKRILDIVVSLTLLVVLLPLMSALAVLIYRRMGAPILFRQERPGRDAQLFTLYKFRTMRAQPSDGADDGADDGARLTRLGRLLRQTSLDELPQLYNVLRGDMSLVGPRPLLPAYLPYYTDWEQDRHAVRPGITGWAQLRGRAELAWDERLALDVWYVHNRSFWLDIRILAATVYQIAHPAYRPPSVSRLGPLDRTRRELMPR